VTVLLVVSGSALFGFLVALPGSRFAPGEVCGAAFCGAFTTYSTLGHETVRLIEERALLLAAMNAAASIVAALGAAFTGMALGNAFVG